MDFLDLCSVVGLENPEDNEKFDEKGTKSKEIATY
jgi:hypothetical protein